MNPNQKLARIGLAVLGLTSATAAWSQANPYYLGASVGITNEKNVYRTPDGFPDEETDYYWTTSLLAGIDQTIGRQRLFADAAARHHKYNQESRLDNTSYGLNIGIDWATIERLSGTVSYSFNEHLAPFGGDVFTLPIKDTETTQEFLARVQYGLASLLSLEGSYIHRTLKYEQRVSDSKELELDTGSIGLQYRPSGLLTLGGGFRFTKGKYPFAQTVEPRADEFDRNDFDLTAVWVPTGISTLRARISFTDEEHDSPAFAVRDYSGFTGALTWEYKPTGKITLITGLMRETGSEGGFVPLAGTASTTTSTSSRVSDAVSVRALYEATAKITAEANFRYTHRDLVTRVILAGGSSVAAGTDKLTEVGLALRYAPTRNWLLSCGIAYEKREASSSVSFPYDANVASCFAEFKLQ
jgi:hypothetical protein